MKYLLRRWVLALAVLLWALPLPAMAQQGESSSKDPTSPAGSADQISIPEASTMAPASSSTRIPVLSSAHSLLPDFSGLRWGPLYVGSAEFQQSFDQISLGGSAGTLNRVVSVARTWIFLDHATRRTRFVLQYMPRLAIVNGRTERDFSNHNLGFDTFFALSPRWTLTFGDQFNYFNNRQLFDEDPNLDLDLTTGTFVQRYFLDNSGRWLSNTARVGLDYHLSARTKLKFSPSYTYASAHQVSTVYDTRRYAGTMSMDHVLDARTTIGLQYTAEKAEFSQLLPGTFYQTVGLNFGRRLSPRWRMNGNIGYSWATDATGGRYRTGTGILGISRESRYSQWSLAYTRGLSYGFHITNQYSDRVDVSYMRRLTARLYAGIGGGYYREFGFVRKTSAEYGMLQFGYRLSRHLSWVTNYVYRTQVGDGTLVAAGHRNYVSTGIRWTAGASEY